MSYFAPYIDESGLHIPTYTDIRYALIADAKNIFGQDIHISEDSQDYQWISANAAYIYDTMQIAQIAYNGRSPSTAIGTTLDSIVKLNGIKRTPARKSGCNVVISGTPGTTINNGVVIDINNNYWDLIGAIVIPISGTIETLAICQKYGPISAAPGDINKIGTPVYGWNSVTNTESATVGQDSETDSQLRIRQSISTAQASRTVLEGIKGAIAAVSNVTRFAVYENDTNGVVNGLPAHSVTAVVEGGTDADIAQAIYLKKAPGCYTNGSVVTDITDSFGQIIPIRFDRPNYVDIDVTITVKSIIGCTASATTAIKDAIAAYLNSLSIGDDISISSLWGAALATQDIKKPMFSITGLTAGKHSQAQGTNDIVIAYNEVTRGNVANITVNVS